MKINSLIVRHFYTNLTKAMSIYHENVSDKAAEGSNPPPPPPGEQKELEHTSETLIRLWLRDALAKSSFRDDQFSSDTGTAFFEAFINAPVGDVDYPYAYESLEQAVAYFLESSDAFRESMLTNLGEKERHCLAESIARHLDEERRKEEVVLSYKALDLEEREDLSVDEVAEYLAEEYAEFDEFRRLAAVARLHNVHGIDALDEFDKHAAELYHENKKYIHTCVPKLLDKHNEMLNQIRPKVETPENQEQQ